MSGKQTRISWGLGFAQQEKVSSMFLKPGSDSAIVRVWARIALATQEASSHYLEKERIWFLRVNANWIKANAY